MKEDGVLLRVEIAPRVERFGERRAIRKPSRLTFGAGSFTVLGYKFRGYGACPAGRDWQIEV